MPPGFFRKRAGLTGSGRLARRSSVCDFRKTCRRSLEIRRFDERNLQNVDFEVHSRYFTEKICFSRDRLAVSGQFLWGARRVGPAIGRIQQTGKIRGAKNRHLAKRRAISRDFMSICVIDGLTLSLFEPFAVFVVLVLVAAWCSYPVWLC